MFCSHPLRGHCLLIITVILATSNRGSCLCRKKQSDALVRLKDNFRFDENCKWGQPRSLSSWKVDANCCTWEGVACDGKSGYVTALDLSFLCISGNLSSSHIFELNSLRSLSLAANNFDASSWPSPGFEQLSHLEYLDLSYSGLSGDLHIDEGQLSKLVTLNLSGLALKYLSLEALIDNLGNLQELELGDANISVTPSDLAQASSTDTPSALKELTMWSSIPNNSLDTVFTNLLFRSKLANLVRLDLSGIDLKIVSLHALIGSFGNLENLYLEDVSISVIPTDLAHAFSTNTTSGLKELRMQWCTITGRHFDAVLTKLPFLSKLTLDGTTFSGPFPVPEHFSEFSSLTVLSLQSCGLTGMFPSSIFRIKSLMYLDVSGNRNLCGELPEFTLASALQILILSGTMFGGNIPESIANLRNLTELDLSNCQFHGLMPPFTQWPMISSIYLSGNNLTSSLPSDGYLALRNLTTVVLSNNSISGVIPASLFSLPSLGSLDLSENNFTGNFLLHPNISSNLRKIDLSNNKLQGPIPNLLSELVGIYWLDLSSNNFSGTVNLSFIKNYRQLDYLSLSYNKLSVVEEAGNQSYVGYPIIQELSLASCDLSSAPKFLMHQTWIYDLDLSNNNIVGHIPDWIWENAIGLNLSHNFFTSIATNLSNTSLFYLDLHSNMIEGALPLPPLGTYQLDYSSNHFNSSVMPQFWSHISSAVSLSLAHNRLIGEVSHLVCNATELGVLDLSFNNFNGLIPPCLLRHNTHLEILNLRGNNFHGSLPQNISKECALQIVDLNGNNLEGKMPMSMTNRHMLQVIDLGNNMILNAFPEWLGVLTLLKVLVLRSNRFHGPINHYGLNKQKHPFFPQLQVLDLSSNSFNGSIPARFLKQFKAMMVVSPGALNSYVGIIGSATASRNNTSDTTPYYRGSVTVMLKASRGKKQLWYRYFLYSWLLISPTTTSKVSSPTRSAT
ncbi:hypothetical protein BS78_07G150200 [Paspalum vaginatum]|nr:hypothetical protein BS78_07G150200 [Paspalum vaginatum]